MLSITLYNTKGNGINIDSNRSSVRLSEGEMTPNFNLLDLCLVLNSETYVLSLIFHIGRMGTGIGQDHYKSVGKLLFGRKNSNRIFRKKKNIQYRIEKKCLQTKAKCIMSQKIRMGAYLE